MSLKVCLLANAIGYPKGGGHLWVYLNWALGLRSLGCSVMWLELLDQRMLEHEVARHVATLKTRLEPYDLARGLAFCSLTGEPLPPDIAIECPNLDAASEADLLLSIRYDPRPELVGRFRRSALVDIDPGLLQFWIAQGLVTLAPYDVFFTTGETVGQPRARFPDCGVHWQYTPPCVALDWWPVHKAADDAPFTTVSHWNTYNEWLVDAGGVHLNDKRAGFLPFLDLPRYTTQPLELALCLASDEQERVALQARGWRVREAWELTATPWDYQGYVQKSRGEFSCAKPSCIRFQNAWISDRTLCYLASGKPAVVQHTGVSRFLPDSGGLFRFRTLEEAVHGLDTVSADYPEQCRLSRALAEEHFDARKVLTSVLERAIT